MCQDIGDTEWGVFYGMARYLVEAHVLEGRSVAELAAVCMLLTDE